MFFTNNEPKDLLANLDEYLDQGPQADPQKLSDIAPWLKRLKSVESSESDVKVVQLLGTAAGKQWNGQSMTCNSEAATHILTVTGVWQGLFREHEILASVLQNLDPSTNGAALNNQYLRVIGNSIAYNGISFPPCGDLSNLFQDPNREVVLDHFTNIVSCLVHKELRRTALAVLYNLGQDYGAYRLRGSWMVF
jgi:hypothetical protein